MHRILLFLLVCSTFFLFGCQKEGKVTKDSSEKGHSEYVIQLDMEDNVSDDTVLEIIGSVNGKRLSEPNSIGSYVIDVEGATMEDLEQICKELLENEQVSDAYVVDNSVKSMPQSIE